MDWVGSLKREFREHREAFVKNVLCEKPIVGFSCWALGYLDANGGAIGCLLHPVRHGGEDLRHLTGYKEKCARELCLQAKHFEALSPETRSFWLGVTEGLGSFYYSSPRANPLFHLLLWGPLILENLAVWGTRNGLTVTEILHDYPFLTREDFVPRGYRFLVESVVQHVPEPNVWENHRIEAAALDIHERLRGALRGFHDELRRPPLVYVHQSGVGVSFADYLLLVHGLRKGNHYELWRLKEEAGETAQVVLQAGP